MDSQHHAPHPFSILTLITDKENILKRWAEHFDSVY